MRFAYSSNAFTGYSVCEAIAAVAALGYDGIEIMADRPHLWPPDTSLLHIGEIRSALCRSGISISNINAFTMHAVGDTWNPSWIDPDPRRRDQRISHTLRCIALAEMLGVRHISTEPGGPLPVGMDREEGIRLFREGLLGICDEARRRGIRILIEPEPGLLIETSQQFEDFFNTLDRRIFGMNLDVGHFYCVGEDPADACRRFSGVFSHVHLEDISGRVHRHLVPGEGDLPLSPVLRTLDSEGYAGFATVELYTCQQDPLAAGAAALGHLKSLLAAEREYSYGRYGRH